MNFFISMMNNLEVNNCTLKMLHKKTEKKLLR
jgi:hypothetical protein